MFKHGNLISLILLCVAFIMLALSSLLIVKSQQQMENRIEELEEQNETILYQYNLQKDEISSIKSLYVYYASETDAQIAELGGDIQELKLEKEVKEVELHQEAEPEEEEEAEPERIEEDSVADNKTYIGCYELTAYEWTGNPCANGNYPTCGYTVACNSLPLGTRVYIEGYGDYTVEDRGGMADSVIDVYMGDYDSCIQFGRRTANVYIYN